VLLPEPLVLPECVEEVLELLLEVAEALLALLLLLLLRSGAPEEPLLDACWLACLRLLGALIAATSKM
jgi:hypothetical protein